MPLLRQPLAGRHADQLCDDQTLVAKFKNYQQMRPAEKWPSFRKKRSQPSSARWRACSAISTASWKWRTAGRAFRGRHQSRGHRVAEAKRCGIPCIALVDTNSDPTTVARPIPGNDDAVKSIRIIVDTLVEAVQKGLAQRDSRRVAHGTADVKAASAAMAAAAVAGARGDRDRPGKDRIAGESQRHRALEEGAAVVTEATGKIAAKKKPSAPSSRPTNKPPGGAPHWANLQATPRSGVIVPTYFLPRLK